MSLPLRKCGGQGFMCSVQGLGCMGMSAFYGGFESEEAQSESLKLLQNACEYSNKIMLDTSDIYGPYTNEELIGKAIAGNRHRYSIATKCGFEITESGVKINSTPEYIKKACEASLKRLGIECIDLYYLHRYDQTTPIEETMKAFKELVNERKIKYVGVSEMSTAVLRKAHAVYPITAYQMEWSLFTRDVEEELVPTCRELGIGIVAYSPLGRGFLTGAIKSADDIPEGDYRRGLPRYGEHMEDNLKLVEVVKTLAAKKGCTPGQLALGWLHSQGDDVFPIPGTKKVKRLEENITGYSVIISQEDEDTLNVIADKIKGTRYDADHMNVTFGGA